MYNPATRLLTILELLQAHDRLSGTELARRLEVDKRSIRRYIVMLQDLGIPIEGTSGIYGGYQLRPGFKLPPLMLTEDEATAVALGLLSSRSLGLVLAPETVEGAIAKIQRVLPEDVRRRVQALQAVLSLDSSAAIPTAESTWLLDLTEAVARGSRVRIHYRAERGEESIRLVDPYGVATRLGHWYVAGYCHLRHDLRLFRLDRIQQLEPTIETFAPPPEFDCVQYVMERIATVPARWSVEVVLRLSLEEAQRRIRPGYAVLQPVERGVHLKGTFNDLEAVARYLIGLGCRFSVLGPEELRAELRHLGQQMIDLADDSS